MLVYNPGERRRPQRGCSDPKIVRCEGGGGQRGIFTLDVVWRRATAFGPTKPLCFVGYAPGDVWKQKHRQLSVDPMQPLLLFVVQNHLPVCSARTMADVLSAFSGEAQDTFQDHGGVVYLFAVDTTYGDLFVAVEFVSLQ